MTFPSNDPYAAPSMIPPKPGMGPAQMRYMEAFQYIFAHPEWTTNVLLAAVCTLIPVIGPILVQGYAIEILESLHRFPGQLYPKFDFGRFSQYLMRGVWPFLVTLVVGFVMTIPMMCIILVPMFAIMAAAGGGGEDAAGPAAGLGICCMYGMMFVYIIAMNVVLLPFILRAGLAQDFGEGFKFNWVMNFFSKMWAQAALAVLFLFAVYSLLTVITCVIGLPLAIALYYLAQAHLMWQLYSIYLARGGEPIPLKPWDGPAPMSPSPM